MATPRKPKRPSVRRGWIEGMDHDRPLPRVDDKLIKRLTAAWGEDGFFAWHKDFLARIRDLTDRLPAREPLSAADRLRLIDAALDGVHALRDLMDHLSDDAALVEQLFPKLRSATPAAVERLDTALAEWSLLLRAAVVAHASGAEADQHRAAGRAYLEHLARLEDEGTVLGDVAMGRALMVYSAIAPRPPLPTPRAIPPLVVEFAREVGDDARLRPILPGVKPVLPTASRDGWFVLALEFAIDHGQLHRYGVTSAAALADKALAR